MERNNQLKYAQDQYVMKCRDRYEQKCIELTNLEQTAKNIAGPPKEIEKVFY